MEERIEGSHEDTGGAHSDTRGRPVFTRAAGALFFVAGYPGFWGVQSHWSGRCTGAVVVLDRRALTDLPTVLLALITLSLLWKWKKVPEPVIVLCAAIVGFTVYTFLHR